MLTLLGLIFDSVLPSKGDEWRDDDADPILGAKFFVNLDVASFAPLLFSSSINFWDFSRVSAKDLSVACT